jgi:hypothetical protein
MSYHIKSAKEVCVPFLFGLIPRISSLNIRCPTCTIIRVSAEFKEPFSVLHEAKYFIREPKVIGGLVNSVEAILG